MSEETNNHNDATIVNPPKTKEPVYHFEFPESIREHWKDRYNSESPKSVGIVESSQERDSLAFKRASARGTDPAAEAVQFCVTHIDGIRKTDDEIEGFFEKAPRKMIELINAAWTEVNLPDKQETRAFLFSRSTSFE